MLRCRPQRGLHDSAGVAPGDPPPCHLCHPRLGRLAAAASRRAGSGGRRATRVFTHALRLSATYAFFRDGDIRQFARVVKGVDLRSTAGNCARVRTPQLTGISQMSRLKYSPPRMLTIVFRFQMPAQRPLLWQQLSASIHAQPGRRRLPQLSGPHRRRKRAW